MIGPVTPGVSSGGHDGNRTHTRHQNTRHAVKLTLSTLAVSPGPCPATVHSLEQALYQVTVLHEGMEKLLSEDNGRILRRRSLLEVKEALAGLPLSSLVLRQQSAYDEMIGQAPREGDNTLEVPLALAAYPALDHA